MKILNWANHVFLIYLNHESFQKWKLKAQETALVKSVNNNK